MFKQRIIQKFTIFLLMPLSTVFAQDWVLTPKSVINFDIRSLGVSVVGGDFKKYQSKMVFDPTQLQTAQVSFVLDVESLVFTRESFKKMILGEDYFDVNKYKTISYKGNKFTALGNHKYRIDGNLTLRGVTKPVTFNTSLAPNKTNPKLYDTKAEAIIHRSDFGMKKAPAGGGEKVNIRLSGQWQQP